METCFDSRNLRCLLADRIPEARNKFMALPGQASVDLTFYTFYEVTTELAHQYKFRAVKRCLQVAEELLLSGDQQVSSTLCSIYIVRLVKVPNKRKAQNELIHYLLPRALRAEYRRRLSSCLA